MTTSATHHRRTIAARALGIAVTALALLLVLTGASFPGSRAFLTVLLSLSAVLHLAPLIPLAPLTPARTDDEPDARRVIAHELRGPLTAAIGHLDLALEPDTDPQQVLRHVTHATSAVARTDDLVDRLLRSDSESPSPSGRERVDLATLLGETLTDFDPLARRRELAISVDHGSAGEESEARANVLGDRRQLRQALDNVISNSVKYADHGSWIDVTIGSGPEDATTELTVTNAGCTLDDDEIATAFTPLVRGTVADSVAPGEGIGLSVVKEIVTAHDGSVELVSDTAAGTTTVRISLPRDADSPPNSPTNAD